MEFPYGHHRHHERDEEEQYPPPSHHRPPPPSYQDEQQYPPPSYQDEQQYPPPSHHRPPPSYQEEQQNPVTHLHHNLQEESYSENRFQRPPTQPDFNYPSFESPTYPPPPQHSQHRFDSEPDYPSVQHVSHELNQGFQPQPSEFPHEPPHHHHRPHLPSFLHHQSHEATELPSQTTVRVFSKAETGYSLTIRDGKVILARSDENDPFQHWTKEEKYSTRVKDEQGYPSFALVNKATGQAMKHSIGATHPVQLIPYNPNALDESILWTESKDLGDGFRTVRMVNNIRLNLDALNGDQNHGGVRDGTILVLWEWKKGENQRWKIVPY